MCWVLGLQCGCVEVVEHLRGGSNRKVIRIIRRTQLPQEQFIFGAGWEQRDGKGGEIEQEPG